ncbi:ubiquitin-like domain-containing protein [Pontibacillus salicampi]|uniref:Ubiquitin-like domain-containing protein n=1 Tax=Pontibacillus salicampi TaxID=1449801 RepID=A0ABV6LTT3_9BACI
MKKLVLSVVSSVVFFALLGSFTYEALKAEVTVSTNEETKTVRTHAKTVGDLLASLDIDVQSHDKISHSTEADITSGMKIDYQSAKAVTLTVDDQTKQYYTVQDTVKDFFQAKDVSISDRDHLSHEKGATIKDGMSIDVRKAFEVSLNDGGKEKNIWTTAQTVEKFLEEQGIELGKQDTLKQNTSDALSHDSSDVTITRVEKVTDVVEESLDYAVVKRNDESIEKGDEKVVQSGKEGVVEKHYEVTLENGKEVKRELVEEKTAKESKDKIVAVGTKVIQQNVSRKSSSSSNSNNNNNTNNPSGSSKTLYMSATAYTANCSGCTGVTTTGINLKSNPNQKVVAVDPSVIPLGTRVWVEGYGYAVAGDTGSAIKGNKIDLYYQSKSAANSFGRRQVRVKVLGK